MSHEEQMASARARWPHGLPVPPDEPLWTELAALWPQGQLVRVAEAGHIISRGRTHEQFMGHLQAFLGQHQLDFWLGKYKARGKSDADETY